MKLNEEKPKLSDSLTQVHLASTRLFPSLTSSFDRASRFRNSLPLYCSVILSFHISAANGMFEPYNLLYFQISIQYQFLVNCLILHSDYSCFCRLKSLLYIIPALDLSCIYLMLIHVSVSKLSLNFCVLCAFVAIISVSSFVKKTTEKINNLQMNSDLWPRPDHRDGGQGEVAPSVTSCPDEVDDG